MPARRIEQALDSLIQLRQTESPAVRERKLRKALTDKVNVIVAKAARLAADLQMHLLVPDLCAAFERLSINSAKTDPQCWGKEAIVKALKSLGYSESGIFLRGAQHVQWEPVWNGEEDTATGVRAACTLALLDCTDLTREDKFWAVMRLLSESSPSLRKDAVLALQFIDGREAALLLRLKARMGDDDSSVMGQTFESLLMIEGESAVPFLEEFLHASSITIQQEAALALGAARLPRAVAALLNIAEHKRPLLDSDILFRALSVSRQEEAMQFLLCVIRDGRVQEAVSALEALQLYPNSSEFQERVKSAVASRREGEIHAALRRWFTQDDPELKTS